MPLDTNTSDQIDSAIQTVQERDDTPGTVQVHVSKKRKQIDPINPFALCFTGSLSTIIQQRQLTSTALALLFLLLDLSRFGNLVSVNQAGLAARLGVKQPAVSKALARLEAAGIILNMPEGQFFNPQIITKQGLDTVARNYPASVSAGIEALRQLGMSPNWEPPRH
ncbi:hypothetical protein B1992_10345 [Pseudoxanthomonas broegbernensis]|uniref:HTH marR-type domain-containing protein n=1 Tax=Pseudoxanthomonas broegbernensis TaxID=83619 RepID=A0A7V8K6G6_9GAMM|nr:helix-turn-helix domain-containing protein [Pseudoxanthomonas broegbernensis]KAF1685865.1 hypothetical protein B1992_10345 [Pseudoxanthomonas broegbernensis]MBB6064083.1 DNA-binding transcriptional ArsR family regulator [Pseudoxanthomonas broegbernensis]